MSQYKRIQVIGCGGAGKSTLAKSLGDLLGIEVYHLDTLFWLPNWQESSMEEFRQKVDAILEKEQWIMDGNYGATMRHRAEHSDLVIYLDFPTLTCLTGAIVRRFVYHNKSRPDMTEGNYERLEWRFIKWVLTYRRLRRPVILAMLNELPAHCEVVVLKSRREVAEFSSRLEEAKKPKRSEQKL
jgi:adenylate kinase family enzyme